MNAEEIKKRFSIRRQMEHLGKPEGAPESLELKAKATSTADSAKQDDSFDLIKTLQGTWTSSDKGWNLIALPFKDPSSPFNYRLLMNQYGETLQFKKADKNVPNRGIDPDVDGVTDQLIDALDYEQVIAQVESEDSPPSTLQQTNGGGLHHEPGLFLHMINHQSSAPSSGQCKGKSQKLEVARLGTIPHGDSVLALGTVEIIDGPPVIPDLDALPIRTAQDVENNPYLAPYKHFEDNPFFGTVPASVPNFPGFFSTNANAILQFANPESRVKKTTILHFDTKFETGGIVNIPFIVKQADATEMEATFWIMELESADQSKPPEFVMQYSQTVFLDFFPSKEDPSKRVRWPHVSINTLSRG